VSQHTLALLSGVWFSSAAGAMAGSSRGVRCNEVQWGTAVQVDGLERKVWIIKRIEARAMQV
jgi:hypothetical protein